MRRGREQGKDVMVRKTVSMIQSTSDTNNAPV
jgi:hypothetical protein